MNVMEDLKAYLDGELSPEKMKRVDAALQDDPKLRRELEELRVLSRLIGDCVVDVEPLGLERTLAAVGRRKRFSFDLVRHGWVVAAACSLIIAAVVTTDQSRSQDEAVATADLGSVALNDSAKRPAEVGASGEINAPATKAAQLDKAEAPARSGFQAMGGIDVRLRKHANTSPRLGEDVSGSPVVPKPATPGFPQQIIRTGDMGLRVADVRKAQGAITNLAKSVGGFIESSNSSADENNLPQASVTMRVPEKRFEDVLNRLRSLGEVKSETLSGEDVTAQVADTEARLRVMRAEEDQYVTLLKSARKIGEILSVKERLSSVREEIESLDAQRKALRNQAAYSTITVSLTQTKVAGEPPAAGSWFDEAWASAVNRGSAFGRWLARVGLNLVAFAPVWVPIVLAAWWLSRRKRVS